VNDWKPYPKQEQALLSTCFETLYGGARGGGKTDAGMAWCCYDIDNPMLRILVIRRNFTDLKDWVDRAERFFGRLGAEFHISAGEIRFPSGAKIILGHLSDDAAYTRYMGHEYQRILIEELTHIPSLELYLRLTASCRSTVPGLKARIFATTNPGEVGHKWVRQRFVDICSPGEVYEDPVTGRKRVFIQARVEDNPALMEADPEYVRFLDGLPDGLREQWREGSWDDVEIKGAYYLPCVKQAQEEQRIGIVEFSPDLPVDTFWDLGIDDHMAVWFVQRLGREIRVIKAMDTSDVGLEWWFGQLQKMPFKNWGTFYYPHDISVRELVSGKTRLATVKEFAAQMNFDVKVLPRINPEERVHATRLIFPRFWFHKPGTADGLDSLRNYHKKFDEKTQTYLAHPHKDWSCHYADSFGMIGLAYEDQKKHQKTQADVDLENRIRNLHAGGLRP
jgi:hypothetical protein